MARLLPSRLSVASVLYPPTLYQHATQESGAHWPSQSSLMPGLVAEL